MLKTIAHGQTGKPISGLPLVAGAHLRSSDQYDSTSGIWMACPAPGVALAEGTATIWVRSGLTADETRLLAALSSQRKGLFDCMVKVPRHAHQFVLIPNVDYTWDPRVETPAVEGYEHLQGLLDVGYLERRNELKNPESGMKFFLLTDLGWEAALGLRN